MPKKFNLRLNDVLRRAGYRDQQGLNKPVVDPSKLAYLNYREIEDGRIIRRTNPATTRLNKP